MSRYASAMLVTTPLHTVAPAMEVSLRGTMIGGQPVAILDQSMRSLPVGSCTRKSVARSQLISLTLSETTRGKRSSSFTSPLASVREIFMSDLAQYSDCSRLSTASLPSSSASACSKTDEACNAYHRVAASGRSLQHVELQPPARGVAASIPRRVVTSSAAGKWRAYIYVPAARSAAGRWRRPCGRRHSC